MKSREKLSNIEGSIRKFFVEHLYQSNNVVVSFDKNIALPYLHDNTISRWVVVIVRNFYLEILDSISVDIFCCVRRDSDLSALVDITLDGIIDNNGEVTAIGLYDSDWSRIGGMPVFFGSIEPNLKLDDQTKFTRIPLTLKWAG